MCGVHACRDVLVWSIFSVSLLMAMSDPIMAHDWHRHSLLNISGELAGDSEHSELSREGTSRRKIVFAAAKAPASRKPAIAEHFEHFENVKVRWDSTTLFVESNGLPNHNMMVGIRNWQQQVPVPQPFTGQNSWKIPLYPKMADRPINAKYTSFRGAIAVAVNGVPIFSALNNRGEDAYLAGELDKWGGHCGRGDDYHYHIAPLHLEEIVGKGNPIAFALDGYPIYGLTEADGSPVGNLDLINGQLDADGSYHYHATKTYPYINGGVRGEVDFRNGEIASQPRDAPIRPGQPPLRGAVITDFRTTAKESTLTYKIQGRTGKITYSPAGEDSYRFTYSEPSGKTWSETYQRRPRPNLPGGSERRGPGRRPPPKR